MWIYDKLSSVYIVVFSLIPTRYAMVPCSLIRLQFGFYCESILKMWLKFRISDFCKGIILGIRGETDWICQKALEAQ